MVAIGPMPGRTPISVPISAPIRQKKMFMGNGTTTPTKGMVRSTNWKTTPKPTANRRVDDASAVVSILKDGKTPVAKAPPNPIVTEFAGSTVGPIPLSTFGPGKYVVQLKVTDKLSKQEIVQEAPLEVQP